MSLNIAPGTPITLKIVKTPTNDAAEKTLIRLLRKDAKVKSEDARLLRARWNASRQQGRGGRVWTVKRPSICPVKIQPGTQGKIVATLDVLCDLKKVARFCEITAA